MCSAPLDLFSMLELGGQQPSTAMVAMNQLTTGGQHLKATVNRRRKKPSGVPNPKRMFEEVNWKYLLIETETHFILFLKRNQYPLNSVLQILLVNLSGSNGPKSKIVFKEYEDCNWLQNEGLRRTSASDVHWVRSPSRRHTSINSLTRSTFGKALDKHFNTLMLFV